ncbi:Crp/Fnr family transcriptional regulator [Zoogloea dura]|uniref:Crp/Fnr family transcriptional regulator n=1 Tax=Zoogloea dura TaxID=2728840 RepID=A0A848G382_9RHOO|nr:Crp/Fnr family transcriptional regulator [Zoogloea dura]NML24141.1 Crp/Fnr family transcriptional regulator [Zoogloea dura]
MSATLAPSANRLLAALPPQENARLLAHCDTVDLQFAEVLAEPGEPIRHVWFPTGSAIAQIRRIDAHASLEVGLIGDEGALGIPLALDATESSLRALVQAPGGALRISAPAFCRVLEDSPALSRILRQYIHVLMGQLAQTAGCTRFHLLEPRLARWLLMTQDRTHSNGFHITHEFLAQILGVRRVGITHAASTLQQHQLIHYRRGDIAIVDRAGLEAAACTCYATDRLAYSRGMRGVAPS